MAMRRPAPRTNTGQHVITHNGNMFAVLHSHKLTGYKSPNAYGHSPVFPTGSTYTEAFRHGPSTSRSAPGSTFPRKELSPYNPNALRSRLPVDFGNSARPGMRFCQPRNVSSFEIVDPNRGHTDAKRFKTMSRSFHARMDPNQGPSNAGVMAESARRLHASIWT